MKALFEHWKSSLFGILGGSFAALAVTANIDSMSAKELVLAYGSCLFVALKGVVSADAKSNQ